MVLREQQRPPVPGGGGDQPIGLAPGAGVEGEVVQARAPPVVPAVGERRGLLDDDVGLAEQPAAPVIPVLERLVAERLEQPADAGDRPRSGTHSSTWCSGPQVIRFSSVLP
jgi:hypothetical protein